MFSILGNDIYNLFAYHYCERFLKKLLDQASDIIDLKHYSYNKRKVILTKLNVGSCFVKNVISKKE